MKSQIRERFEKFIFNNAQILALPTTDITLVPGSVAGLTAFLVPLWASMTFHNVANVTGIDDPGSTIEINGPRAGDLSMFMQDTANGVHNVSSFLAGGAGDVQATVGMFQGTGKPVPSSTLPSINVAGQPLANTPILLQSANAMNFTGGNAGNTLTIWLAYRIVNL